MKTTEQAFKDLDSAANDFGKSLNDVFPFLESAAKQIQELIVKNQPKNK